MSRFDDDLGVWSLPDDELLSGEVVPDEPELVAFVASLRATATVPAPPPSAALRAAMAGGPSRSEPKRPVRLSRGASLGVKVALGVGVAVASVTGAAALDAVPDSVQGPSHTVVTAVADAWTRTVGWLTASDGPDGAATGVPGPRGPDASRNDGRGDDAPPPDQGSGTGPSVTAPGSGSVGSAGAGRAAEPSPGDGPGWTDDAGRSRGVPSTGSEAEDDSAGHGADDAPVGADRARSEEARPADRQGGRGDATQPQATPDAVLSPSPAASPANP